ncbi:penicillin acylase family protein [Patulibacter defluvii]|uniref:penicillin acylase family protein n=1 Tax=Patulibacter defluvii TaxID=3095358 RepID=UPI002A749EBD|nr:penicillin acylase family protein [Patulibacter sp. DM4]
MTRRALTSTLALLALALAPAAAGAAPARPAATPRYDVTVTRTAYGIPHIKARDYASLGYGYAQALAEDAVCTVAEAYVTSNGERSRWFGPDKGYAIRGNGSTANNLNSDFFYQRIRDRKTVERLAAQAPPLGPKPEIKQALEGYVDGWNAWLKRVGGTKGIPDRTCRGEGWVRPITIGDVYRRFYSLSILASSGVAIDGIAGAQPLLTGPVDVVERAKSIPAGELDRRLGGLGSNAYAIGRSGSRDGHGLLYGNPHFPWQGPERFYQAHLTVPGKVDVTGGSLMGVPIVLIGTTKGMAWSHTVSTARRFVPYQLTMLGPTTYVEDGQLKQLKGERVTVQVRGAGGRLESRSRTLWSSEHGPIFTSLLGLPLFPWTPVTAFALYDGNGENFGRLMNHFFSMNFAQSVPEVDRILRKYEGIPWVNTIAADTAGNAYYADIGSIPNIDRAKYDQCEQVLGHVTDLLQRLPVLDGARRACLPGNDPDAIAPGILGPSKMPSLRRDDHVSNMNDSYWLTNPAQPLEGFSKIIGDERTPRSLRTRIGLKQLQQRIDGSDGLPGKGFDLQNLMRVGMGNRVYSAEIWRDTLVAGCGSEACRVLRAWNMRNDLDAKGAVLWQRFVTRLTGALPIALPAGLLGPFATAFDHRDAVNTPGGLNMLNPMVAGSLQQAISDLQGAGLPLDATLRQGQSVTRRGERIPIQGGPHASGVFNVVTPVWDPKKGYTEVVHGSSFIQAVHLKPGCPDVRTLLTYGESTNPGSVHSSDQTKLFSRKQWVKAPFCPADLEADPTDDRVRTVDLRPAQPLLVTLREARGSARPRLTVTNTAGASGRVAIRIRRGKRVVRRIARRGAVVAVSPRVKRGDYAIAVTVGGQTIQLGGRQR